MADDEEEDMVYDDFASDGVAGKFHYEDVGNHFVNSDDSSTNRNKQQQTSVSINHLIHRDQEELSSSFIQNSSASYCCHYSVSENRTISNNNNKRKMKEKETNRQQQELLLLSTVKCSDSSSSGLHSDQHCDHHPNQPHKCPSANQQLSLLLLLNNPRKEIENSKQKTNSVPLLLDYTGKFPDTYSASRTNRFFNSFCCCPSSSIVPSCCLPSEQSFHLSCLSTNKNKVSHSDSTYICNRQNFDSTKTTTTSSALNNNNNDNVSRSTFILNHRPASSHSPSPSHCSSFNRSSSSSAYHRKVSRHSPSSSSLSVSVAAASSSKLHPYSLCSSSCVSFSTSSKSSKANKNPLFSIKYLFLTTLVLLQLVTTVSAMLDALKALFILTGASTYLVTKYVNITNRTDTGGYYPMMAGGNFNLNNNSRTNPFNPALNFYKGDLQKFPGTGNGGPFSSNSMRPMYVLAIEEEEDEKLLPKLLLKLSISDSRLNQTQSGSGSGSAFSSGHQFADGGASYANSSFLIEYILEAKMDDMNDVYENFVVNKSSGELFLIRPLDRDPPKGRPSWKFSVQARNAATQFILAVADVLITVRDINDNKPMFEQQIYRTMLMENGAAGQILTKVNAVDFDDADTADYGKVVYSLLKSQSSTTVTDQYGRNSKSPIDYFQLDPHSGVLTALACCFDREKRSEYELVVRATDAGGLWDEAKIVVTIGDQNDCPPRFLNPSRTLVLNDEDDNENTNNNNDIDSNSHRIQHEEPELEHFDDRGQQHLRPITPTGANNENIFTFYVSDDDLPESNHFSYEIVNSTNCSLFSTFYMVVNDDGSGSLFGSRIKPETPLEHNKTYSCQLTVSVHDRSSSGSTDLNDSGGGKSAPQSFEDQTTLTLVYRNITEPPREPSPVRTKLSHQTATDNAGVVVGRIDDAAVSGGSSSNGRDLDGNVNHLKKQLSSQLGKSSDDDSNEPKAYDLTGKQTPHSECALCQNGGQCIVTETGYRFRCYCKRGYEGALCERQLAGQTEFNRLLFNISTNELLFYGSMIIIANLLVIVLGLMAWIIRRVRHSIQNSASNSAVNDNVDVDGQPPSMLMDKCLNNSTSAELTEPHHNIYERTTMSEQIESSQKLISNHHPHHYGGVNLHLGPDDGSVDCNDNDDGCGRDNRITTATITAALSGCPTIIDLDNSALTAIDLNHNNGNNTIHLPQQPQITEQYYIA